jgi:hypothetical protein
MVFAAQRHLTGICKDVIKMYAVAHTLNENHGPEVRKSRLEMVSFG